MKLRTSLFCSILFFWGTVSFSQNSEKARHYNTAKLFEKHFDLVHTKLAVRLDFEKEELEGEAWLDVTPHFYSTNKLILDAKAMLIHEVSSEKKHLDFHYDGEKIYIDLGVTLQKGDSLKVFVSYTARPNKVKQTGSAAITSAKGLYFINSKGDSNAKPTQAWTQGATEASSCWFPTIDKPNQKTSQEIHIRVPEKYKTLSNGVLVSQTPVANKERIDYWKMDQKHAPYLFFIGVGAFSLIKDTWKGKEVNYYVEKEYEGLAHKIFGKTPEMMEFFSNITGVDFVWDKYSQMVVRDFVSGAMENTTAVVHQEGAYQSEGDLIDENKWETIIAHELFHHWFGNLVTTENWGNITLNESFANYSEYLWLEHAYGKERADAHLFQEASVYKKGENSQKHLVRYSYENKEDVFDAVTYNKGGLILHMLRNFLGDAAFFNGIQNYLIQNKYQAAEVAQLRMAFEAVSGKDLNWFFNQWYFGPGHPNVFVTQDYNILEKTVTVTFKQNMQNTFYFPLQIEVFENGRKTVHELFVDNSEKSFVYQYEVYPDLVLVNSNHVILGDFIQKKSTKEYLFQYNNASHHLDRKEALQELIGEQENKEVFESIVTAFDDPYYELQVFALEYIDLSYKHSKRKVISKIETLAKKSKNNFVKAAAIKVLGRLVYFDYQDFFEKSIESESNKVKASALESLYYLNEERALEKAKELPKSVKKAIAFPLAKMYFQKREVSEMAFVASYIIQGMYLGKDKQSNQLFEKAFQWVAMSNDRRAYKNLLDDMISKGIRYKQYNFDQKMIEMMRQMVREQELQANSNKKELIALVNRALVQLVRI
jgi:aminopeptidase N